MSMRLRGCAHKNEERSACAGERETVCVMVVRRDVRQLSIPRRLKTNNDEEAGTFEVEREYWVRARRRGGGSNARVLDPLAPAHARATCGRSCLRSLLPYHCPTAGWCTWYGNGTLTSVSSRHR